MSSHVAEDEPVLIWTGDLVLDGLLTVPRQSSALILIAGIASTTVQPGYRALAARLQKAGLATLLADMLTPDEQQFDSRTGHFRLDIPFLAKRLRAITRWIEKSDATRDLPMAYFGTSVSGTAGVVAAAEGAPFFSLVLSRPRLDLAPDAARRIAVPLLLIQDADQFAVRALREDEGSLAAPHRMDIVPGAADVLGDPEAAVAIANHAVGWYRVNTPAMAGLRGV